VAIDSQAAACAVIVSEKQLNYCALAAAGFTNNRIYFVSTKLDGNIFENVISLRLGVLINF